MESHVESDGYFDVAVFFFGSCQHVREIVRAKFYLAAAVGAAVSVAARRLAGWKWEVGGRVREGEGVAFCGLILLGRRGCELGEVSGAKLIKIIAVH